VWWFTLRGNTGKPPARGMRSGCQVWRTLMPVVPSRGLAPMSGEELSTCLESSLGACVGSQFTRGGVGTLGHGVGAADLWGLCNTLRSPPPLLPLLRHSLDGTVWIPTALPQATPWGDHPPVPLACGASWCQCLTLSVGRADAVAQALSWFLYVVMRVGAWSQSAPACTPRDGAPGPHSRHRRHLSTASGRGQASVPLRCSRDPGRSRSWLLGRACGRVWCMSRPWCSPPSTLVWRRSFIS
jgi:hypothetical protein